MQDFTFHQPKSLSEAITLLKDADEGKFMAGGQSLIPVMKLDMAAYTDLISLTEIRELSGVRVDGTTVAVGANTTHSEVAASPEVRESIPALAELASHIGDAQVRNRGTLGGAVAHADPAADYPAAVVALRSMIRTDRRTIEADGFFSGMFETVLEPDEIIVEIRFRIPRFASYAKFENPASKYAIAGVFVARYEDAVRVAVTGAGPVVFRVTAMEDALTQDFSEGALTEIAISSEGLNDEPEATPAYRAHLIGVMARRAVSGAR